MLFSGWTIHANSTWPIILLSETAQCICNKIMWPPSPMLSHVTCQRWEWEETRLNCTWALSHKVCIQLQLLNDYRLTYEKYKGKKFWRGHFGMQPLNIAQQVLTLASWHQRNKEFFILVFSWLKFNKNLI